MSKILFENKKAALGFAGAIVLGAMVFSGISGSSDDDASERRNSRFAQVSESDPAKSRNSSEEAEEDEISFADDEELIDGAGGFDPTPDGASDELEEDEERRVEEEDEEEDEEDARSSDPYADLYEDEEDLYEGLM